MSHGSSHRFPAEHHVAELARLMAIPAVAERMGHAPEIVTKFDVPDLGGYSTDGNRIYLDQAFAKSDARGLSKPIIEHEHVEKTLIDVLGYSYAQAHEMATAAEHELVHKSGLDPAAYEARLKPFIKRAEHEKITNPPKDLDCHPYYEHPDKQDLVILAHLASLGVVDARHERSKLAHKAVQYGPGHAPEFCNKCQHFYQTRVSKAGTDNSSITPHCHVVQDPIQQAGWCKLWARKK